MRKVAAFIVVFALLLGSAAFAEDGFKVNVGYSLMYRDTSIDLNNVGVSSYPIPFGAEVSSNGFMHGPSLSVGYEQGPIFTRFMFDYNMYPDGSVDLPPAVSGYVSGLKFDGHVWKVEANIGYKLLTQRCLDLTPYIGFGYRENKSTVKNIPYSLPADVSLESTSPYAVVGLITKYNQPDWTLALDIAALVPFGGDSSACYDNVCVSLKNDVGIGFRAQLPFTYTLVPKKGHKVGIDLFLTPFYEYFKTNTDVNLAVPISSGMNVYGKLRVSDNTFGAKFGVGFTF
jgi:hypothetical protein